MNAVQAMNGIGNIHVRIKNEKKAIIIEIEDTGLEYHKTYYQKYSSHYLQQDR